MSSSADSPLLCFFVKARLGGWRAAGSGAFPARELSVQERVSSADSSLVHFLVKSRQIKRAARDLFRNKIDNGIHRSGGVPRKRESIRDIDSRGSRLASGLPPFCGVIERRANPDRGWVRGRIPRTDGSC